MVRCAGFEGSRGLCSWVVWIAEVDRRRVSLVPARDERVGSWGSSLFARERRGRRRAGSRIAGGKAARSVAGSSRALRKRAVEEHLAMEGALEPERLLPLTREQKKRPQRSVCLRHAEEDGAR